MRENIKRIHGKDSDWWIYVQRRFLCVVPGSFFGMEHDLHGAPSWLLIFLKGVSFCLSSCLFSSVLPANQFCYINCLYNMEWEDLDNVIQRPHSNWGQLECPMTKSSPQVCIIAHLCSAPPEISPCHFCSIGTHRITIPAGIVLELSFLLRILHYSWCHQFCELGRMGGNNPLNRFASPVPSPLLFLPCPF